MPVVPDRPQAAPINARDTGHEHDGIPTTDQKVRGSNPFGRTTLTSTNGQDSAPQKVRQGDEWSHRSSSARSPEVRGACGRARRDRPRAGSACHRGVGRRLGRDGHTEYERAGNQVDNLTIAAAAGVCFDVHRQGESPEADAAGCAQDRARQIYLGGDAFTMRIARRRAHDILRECRVTVLEVADELEDRGIVRFDP